jgi:hypothetical protein
MKYYLEIERRYYGTTEVIDTYYTNDTIDAGIAQYLPSLVMDGDTIEVMAVADDGIGQHTYCGLVSPKGTVFDYLNGETIVQPAGTKMSDVLKRAFA